MKKAVLKSIFMEMFGASPAVRVLDYLLSVYPLDCSITDIAENAQISRTTLHYNIVPDLVKNEVLAVTRELGRIKLYRLNEKNPLVKKLLEVDKELVLNELNKRLQRRAAAVTV
ncbi:hypothetical protein HYU17_02240 [Candidatus Woesearchaeota archaeon]|nr:hypothetical protein [Candidatus Woesearchaeota archaeon]